MFQKFIDETTSEKTWDYLVLALFVAMVIGLLAFFVDGLTVGWAYANLIERVLAALFGTLCLVYGRCIYVAIAAPGTEQVTEQGN